MQAAPHTAATLHSAPDLRARAANRLRPADALARPAPPPRPSAESLGDHSLNPGLDLEGMLPARYKAAAVLVPLVERAGGLNVMLTLRTDHLPTHAGQISFPGGKIDAGDASPLAAALREAHEEIGLAAADVDILGALDAYHTATGYHIAPAVGLVRAGFAPILAPDEVAEVFEVPLAFLMDAANHRIDSRSWRGRTRHFYAMPFDERYIWGATAGIIRNLYDRLYG